MLKSLNDLGYAVEWRVINAADYGMPQKDIGYISSVIINLCRLQKIKEYKKYMDYQRGCSC